VGDYVRRLAIALQQQGHCVAAIAFNDVFVTEASVSTQLIDAGELTAVRLPATWPITKRVTYVREWLASFEADWLSLQFVPFSFHPKGLIWELAKHLQALGHTRWHLMVHELWVGMEQAASLKHMWWGHLQRYLIRRLIAAIQPKVIHTQNTLYQLQLAKLGFASHYLPLFANIPRTAGLAASSQQSGTLTLVAFGSIHPGTFFEQLTQDVAGYAQQHALTAVLTFVGRCGAEQARWAAIWQAAGLPVKILGEQPPSGISQVLLDSTLGLATTPAALLGKSGTVAAMHEHGLPVLCIASPWQPRGFRFVPLPDGIVAYQPGSFASCLQQTTSPIANKVDDIACQLSKTLLAAS
jgi:hypothetical protein